MDDEVDWDRDEIVDVDGGGWADMTGNPALDVDGYSSPSRKGQNLTGYTPNQIDWMAASRADRERRAARRAQRAAKSDSRPTRAERRAAAEQADEEWRAKRAARWEAEGRLTPRNESSGERVEQKSQPVQTPSDCDEIARRSLTELQPGQKGAYFEKRTYRPWYAPWKKVTRWQQISAWQNTTPPTSGTEVVTVGDVSGLPGKVRTIGKVSDTGAVEY